MSKASSAKVDGVKDAEEAGLEAAGLFLDKADSAAAGGLREPGLETSAGTASESGAEAAVAALLRASGRLAAGRTRLADDASISVEVFVELKCAVVLNAPIPETPETPLATGMEDEESCLFFPPSFRAAAAKRASAAAAMLDVFLVLLVGAASVLEGSIMIRCAVLNYRAEAAAAHRKEAATCPGLIRAFEEATTAEGPAGAQIPARVSAAS